LYIVAIEKFLPLCEKYGDTETVEHYKKVKEELKSAVEEKAFYGDRYARAICDDGTVLGIESCEECKIDILSQAFSAIANLDEERTKKALECAFTNLYDGKEKIFKLFSPPFANGKTRVGYIRGYVAGIRENGGQYTHGALWGALGCFKAGLDEEGLLILDCANPANHNSDKEKTEKYKTEPYAVSADIYSGEFAGRGGWSWYTGAAAWYYRIMLEYVLGLKLGNNKIVSALPIIEFEAVFEFENAKLKIIASSKIKTPLLDGQEISFPLSIPTGEHILELPLKKQ
jgi:cellobiose phosphorylase